MPKEIYKIPASSPSHNVTYVTVVEDDERRRLGDVRGGRRLHGHDGRVGLRGVGHRLVLPAVLGYGGYYPDLLPALPDLRLRRLVQPVDRRVRPRRGRPTGRTAAPARRALQPAHRHVLARRGGLRPVRRARRGAGVQPAHRRRTATTRQGSNVYGSWGATSVQRGDDWAQHRARHQQRDRRHDARDAHRRGRRGRRRNGPGPAAAGVVAGNGGDIYAGHDGNVYSKDGGGWQKYDNGNWSNVDRPDSNVDRDSAARTEGATRTRDSGKYQRSGGSSAGSYRGGGGSAAAAAVPAGGGGQTAGETGACKVQGCKVQDASAPAPEPLHLSTAALRHRCTLHSEPLHSAL